MNNIQPIINQVPALDINKLRIKLYKEMVFRFTENKIKQDSDGSIYFTNEPYLYLPWSKRNKTFTDLEKYYIEANFINKAEGNLFYFEDMRWRTSCKSIRHFYKALEIDTIPEEILNATPN